MFRIALILPLFTAVPGFAQLVSYDCTTFPEDSGDNWVRTEQVNPADRWLDNGWFVQFAEILPCPPDCTTQGFYRHELVLQSGTQNWFMQWEMEVDQEAVFQDVAPAGIVAGGTSGIEYHFTIGSDKVQFRRDPFLPIIVADITPGPHVYRVELDGTTSYTFLIDGEVIDTGVPEGAYPTSDSRITFGARAGVDDSLTRWSFIAFGAVEKEPVPAMSQWGTVAMILLLLTCATVVFQQSRHLSVTNS